MPIQDQRRSYGIWVTWLLLGAVGAMTFAASFGELAEAAAKRRPFRHFETCDDRILSAQRATHKTLRWRRWLSRSCQQGKAESGDDLSHGWSPLQEDDVLGNGDSGHSDRGDHGDHAGGQDNGDGAENDGGGGNTGGGQDNDNGGSETKDGNKGGGGSGADNGGKSGKGKGGGSTS